MNFQSYSHTSGMVNSPPQSHHMDYPNNSAPVVNPRSASELIQDHGNKFRQLPCRTFISVGTCPYRERCVYLHDPRCICRDAKTKTRRKNKDDVVLDSMFWPIMSYNSVATKLDNNRQPHVIQPYVVPPAQNDQYRRHDEAVYSMWMHFVDSCLAMSESPQVHGRADAAPCFAAPDLPINAYTKQPRLPVMRVLSGANRREVSREELMAAEFGHFDSRGGSAAAEFPAKTYLRQLTAGTLHPSVYHGVRPQEESSKSEAKGSANSPNSVSLRSPPRATYADMANAQNIVDLCSNSVDSFHSIPEYDSNTSDSSRRSSLNDVKVDVKAGVERRSPDGPSLLWKQAQQPLNSGINTIESLKTFAGFSSTAMPSFLAFN